MQIWFENLAVASLDQGPDELTLKYEPTWVSRRGAFPISTRMPFSQSEYKGRDVASWISNLLPESRQLEMISRAVGTASTDLLGILSSIGRDTSGALSFAQRGTAQLIYRKVGGEEDLERIIEELPAKPFLVGDDGVSMSLAGVQTKIGVHVDEEGRICIPVDGSPSSWILKPDSRDLWGSVWNEAFCLLLAKNVGLDVPECRTGRAGARRFLLVKRYDRAVQGEYLRRLHQEDFCQALGLPPYAKYERNGTGTSGPKLSHLVTTARKVADERAPLTILEKAIFNIVCCNTDAHAKNYSLLISSRGSRVAPLYDVMCGSVWPSITKNLANSIAGKTRGDYLKGRHWQREAIACGVNPSGLLSMVNRICTKVLDRLDDTFAELEAMDSESSGMASLVRDEIRQRSIFLQNGLKEVETKKVLRLKTTPKAGAEADTPEP